MIEPNKLAEIQTAEDAKNSPHAHNKPFGSEWGSSYWGKWQTISFALDALGVPSGSSVLDVGVGGGWTTMFLSRRGYSATGIDIAPASIEIAEKRAATEAPGARFRVADMDEFQLGSEFDAALIFDALHHSQRQGTVVQNVAQHLRPGGWALFAEPSWLHGISPHARRTARELGWIERGITVRQLKRDCRSAGLGNFRRFYESSAPHEGRVPMVFQMVRMIGGAVSTAPQMSVWIAAQKVEPS